ncbi:unnamed protein product [Ostreobium quekettii]|uniref:3'-phosphate/5'-hydroxy nucleic acid ligase n=1 Tax=Ostreobium quekettii TaxID=121088 RepID=A0A8S1JB21_9CHLO|nr:unnamed protein product [Ostreobium quekettii]|eukprot:evm.model.scf_1615.2 EVM.evm.TU.scf_1615.2   scf_1615:11893-15982(+)
MCHGYATRMLQHEFRNAATRHRLHTSAASPLQPPGIYARVAVRRHGEPTWKAPGTQNCLPAQAAPGTPRKLRSSLGTAQGDRASKIDVAEQTRPMVRRVTIKLADGSGSQKTAVLDTGDGYEKLLGLVENKFRIKKLQLFMPDGLEITDNEHVALITNGSLLTARKGTKKARKSANPVDGYQHSTTVDCSTQSIDNPHLGGACTEGSTSLSTAQDGHVDGHDSACNPSLERPGPSSDAVVHILANKSDLEAEAVQQLHRAAYHFPSIRMAIGMPDLHPGPSFPIGATFAVKGQVMPFLVGNDVGCGMTLFRTSLKNKDSAKQAEKWSKLLEPMEGPWEGDTEGWLSRYGIARTNFDRDCLGTVGGGNHFAELQGVEEVLDPVTFENLEMKQNKMYLLVHSGSRQLGKRVLEDYLDTKGVVPIDEGTADFQEYMTAHDHACRWAQCNRRLIAHRFLSSLGANIADVDDPVLDVCHNNVVKTEALSGDGHLWLHRKGAAPADCGPVIIPGSRGTHSFLVLPTSDAGSQRKAAYSLAHGAGRRWNRGKALSMGQARFPNAKVLRTTALEGHVVCDSAALMYEEHPDAYKEISTVLEDLEAAGLITVVAVMKPVVTYKMMVAKREAERRDRERRWDTHSGVLE